MLRGPAPTSIEITSVSGNLANFRYQSLKLTLALAGKLAGYPAQGKGVFGEIVATGDTRLEAAAPMTASVSFSNPDLQQALEAQKSKAAGTVSRWLGGSINVTGKTGSFDQMKPTLKGKDALMLTNGKLVGVNIGGRGAQEGAETAGDRQSGSRRRPRNHPELFNNPDTDIQIANLNFVLPVRDYVARHQGETVDTICWATDGSTWTRRWISGGNRALAAIQHGADRE